jgi:hypothetical protein
MATDMHVIIEELPEEVFSLQSDPKLDQWDKPKLPL